MDFSAEDGADDFLDTLAYARRLGYTIQEIIGTILSTIAKMRCVNEPFGAKQHSSLITFWPMGIAPKNAWWRKLEWILRGSMWCLMVPMRVFIRISQTAPGRVATFLFPMIISYSYFSEILKATRVWMCSWKCLSPSGRSLQTPGW